ncbi:MFS transporter [Flavobacteriaceae bacterium TP-CH-4]|uniref:MFS transporter n=1 Tax=Pelagihabitans pacificus TaxID=2696054 RepID=A0A967E6A8_9FLAO|nr:MFS transporter [Pelagihabitans pacificus]NHF59430.1 MFS transporter [Pelagihabitans pacificus]
MKTRPHILPTIIISQFACTSLWFAGNAIVDQLARKTGLGPEIIGYVLSSVQLGFIMGTLVFAFLMIADRFSPSRVFLICAILGALCNLCLLFEEISQWALLAARFGTGFFLAGIYPVGMKIAADYYERGLGRALGYLVGALVLGTAFPFLVKALSIDTNGAMVIKTTSLLAALGGCTLWLFVPNGPFRKRSKKLQLSAGPTLFKIGGFQKAAFGYFGHMWELYAFWAFTPLALQTFNAMNNKEFPVAIATFMVIAMGGVSCMLGGLLSQRFGSKKVAQSSLTVSGLFCLVSPLLFYLDPLLFMAAWCLWGMAVTADSPQFSTLVAINVPSELKGTALTLVNCIGFAISIVSIQLGSFVLKGVNPQFLFLMLALGPIIGIWQLTKKAINF